MYNTTLSLIDTRIVGDITSFLVEKNMPGFTLGQKIEDKCGMRASLTAELVFSDVHVPLRNVVGTVGGASLCMMRNLEIERVVLAAMSVGIARRCIELMSAYAQVGVVCFSARIHMLLIFINTLFVPFIIWITTTYRLSTHS